jgi:hypothetical protein
MYLIIYQSLFFIDLLFVCKSFRRHTPGRPPQAREKKLKSFSHFPCLVPVVLSGKEPKKFY